ncbi:MAG: hypothetical protein LBU92_06070, partial [Prevotellaceae bacterium]|nr:hypothetical protein [Prevotellaceae bacterium]
AYKIWAEKIQPIPIDESKRPVVVSISELTNGDTNVSADIKTITANFSMPLSGGNSYSVYAENESDIPQVKGVKFTNNNQSFVMEVSLERDKEYHFVYTGEGFVSADGIGIKDYEVKFKTER